MNPLYPEDPTTVGPFRLLGRLGAGGMGQVFLGRSGSGRMVAVKVVRGELASHPDFRRRFRAEVAAAQRVGGTWTAPVLEFDTESAVPWVATGFVVGPSLGQVVDLERGPLPERSVWGLTLGLARALTEVHGSGLIHRDLKPSNVMVTLDGPKVIDFGIARAVDASVVTRSGALVGSPGYMPPEQIRGEELTGAADVFALGAVLAFTATGSAPFARNDPQYHTVLYRVMNESPHLGAEDGQLGGELRELVSRCLAKEAGERPGLEEIAALAQQRAGGELWLPQALTARLGRYAADLLSFEGPEGDTPLPSWVPEPTSALPPVRPDQTTLLPPEFKLAQASDSPETPGSSSSLPPVVRIDPDNPPVRTGGFLGSALRRRRYLLGTVSGVAVALAVTIALIVANTGGGEAGAPSDDAAEGDGPGTSAAELVPAELREAGVLTVHTADVHDPVNSVEDGVDTPFGFEADLVKAIGERLDVRVTFVVESHRDVVAETAVRQGADSATHVAMAGLTDSPEDRDAAGVDFVNHFVDGLGVVFRAGERPRGLFELCGLTVATYDDDRMRDRVRDHTSNCTDPVKLLLLGGREEMLEAVRSQRADAVVLNYTQAEPYVWEQKLDDELNVSLESPQRGSRGIAVPKGQDALREALFAAMRELLADGTYEQLTQRWHIPQSAIREADVNRGH